jgi:hypothetical protein
MFEDNLLNKFNITNISIGTHNSAAIGSNLLYDMSFISIMNMIFYSGWANCQTLNLKEQVEYGVNMFDLRYFYNKKDESFVVSHTFPTIYTLYVALTDIFETSLKLQKQLITIKLENDNGIQELFHSADKPVIELLIKLFKSISNGKFGPAWRDFLECLSKGSLFAIITARGHEAPAMRKGVEWIIDNELSEEQLYSMYNNLLKFAYLFKDESEYPRILKGQPSKDRLVNLYLDIKQKKYNEAMIFYLDLGTDLNIKDKYGKLGYYFFNNEQIIRALDNYEFKNNGYLCIRIFVRNFWQFFVCINSLQSIGIFIKYVWPSVKVWKKIHKLF